MRRARRQEKTSNDVQAQQIACVPHQPSDGDRLSIVDRQPIDGFCIARVASESVE